MFDFEISRFSDFEVFRKAEYRDIEINGRKYHLNTRPYLDIVLTDFCNQRCGFCIADLVEKKEKCDIEVFKRKIIWAIENLGVKEVLLLGGEPTVSKDLIPLTHWLHDLGLEKICITTNGARIFQNKGSYGEALLNSGVTHLNLSLMSLYSDKQKEISGSNNTVTMKDLDWLRRHTAETVQLRINNNVFLHNNDVLDDVITFYKIVSSFADTVKFSPLLKVDNFSVMNVTTEWVNKHILKDETYECLWKSVEEYFSDYPIVRNPLTLGFVEYSMIIQKTPLILNYNHRGRMAYFASKGYINGVKLLTNGNLSLSWNREDLDKVIL
jgi:organic radical activating enzyme